jgi:hypothetical protein
VHAALPTPDATGRRYEGPAVRRALPLFVVFLAVSAVHPLPETLRAARPRGRVVGVGERRRARRAGACGGVRRAGFVLASCAGDATSRCGPRGDGSGRGASRPPAPSRRSARCTPRTPRESRAPSVAVLGVRLGVAIYACHRDHVRARRGLAGGERPVGARNAAPAPRAVAAHALRPRGRRRGT